MFDYIPKWLKITTVVLIVVAAGNVGAIYVVSQGKNKVVYESSTGIFLNNGTVLHIPYHRALVLLYNISASQRIIGEFHVSGQFTVQVVPASWYYYLLNSSLRMMPGGPRTTSIIIKPGTFSFSNLTPFPGFNSNNSGNASVIELVDMSSWPSATLTVLQTVMVAYHPSPPYSNNIDG